MPWLIILTFILVPTYTVKLNVFGLPTNLLMFWVVLVWLVFFIWLVAKKQLSQFLTTVKNWDKPILIFIGLFLLSGLVGLFINGTDRAKLGQFIVLFLQPISLFFIGKFIFNQNSNSKNCLLYTVYCLLALSGLLAILQYFTLLGLPPAWWGNAVEPKRAIGFFSHPNFFALWSAPLLALLIPDLGKRMQNWKLEIACLPARQGNWKFFTAWLLGAIGLLLSFSRAGWLGLAAAILVYLVVAADNKIRKFTFTGIIIALVITMAVPNLRWRFILPFYGEKSAVSRLSLWQTGWKGIKESPVLGLGLTGFSNNWHRLNTDPGLTDTHNFPHNIFLDLWVETGLLGLVSFIGIVSIFIYRGLRRSPPPLARGGDGGEVERLQFNQTLKLSLTLFLIALLTQGLIDNPYFKNDLAMVFWIILSLAI